MSFKSEIDQLRKMQAEYPDENCIEYIKEIIREKIHQCEHRERIVILYDHIFKSELHADVMNYLTQEGFHVENHYTYVMTHESAIPYSYLCGIVILFEDQ
ncbi:MAG TPA: hypothetical protein VGW78_06685 [Candidatus Babeliales bacterium]|nr:hypothetical protein [Candidatus Babeliales bacterium]